jgi:hypothetical protein
MARWSGDLIRKTKLHLGTVVADTEAEAIKEAIRRFQINPARQFIDHGHQDRGQRMRSSLNARCRHSTQITPVPAVPVSRDAVRPACFRVLGGRDFRKLRVTTPCNWLYI